ncbi:MAG: DUF3486 family protein [Rhodospirillales bacterium]
MPPKSTVKKLPEEILDRVNKMLTDEELELDEIVDYLDTVGHPKSRSAVGRYKQKLDVAGRCLREQRMIVDALGKELGDAAMQGKQGRLLVELARTLAFDMIVKIRKAGGDVTPKDVAALGKGLAELSRAQRFDQDFETNIREMVGKEHAEKLKNALGEAQAAGEPGLSAERVEQLRRDFLGVPLPTIEHESEK